MRNFPRVTPLAALIGLALAAPAFADEAVDLPRVDVTATKPTIKLDTPGTVTVIDRERIDRYMVQNIRDLVRYEPGVSVVGSPGRFGLESFNIRGLAGNRTRIEVDGVSLPASFASAVAGSSLRAGRNQIDVDNIKDVEIVRGPASALYASDALGGVVNLRTKDPIDYLQPGKTFGGQAKVSYDSVDDSKGAVATVAFGDVRDSLLLQASYREGHETENKGEVGGTGATRTRAEPQDYKQTGFLAKYVHNADSGRRDFVGIESARTDTDTNGLSSVTGAASYYLAQDSNRRFKLNFGQSYRELGSALADSLDWNGYWQKTSSRTNTQTDTAAYRRYYYVLPSQEKTYGGKLVAEKRLEGGGVGQTLSYGLELSRTTPKGYADGYGVSKTTGLSGSASPYLPSTYPLHLFPKSDTDRYALFAQDRIELADGRLSIVPGVRVDRYEYKPGDDALYYSQVGNAAASDYTATEVSPKLGLQWKFSDGLSAYFNYAEGFRPPLYNEIDGAWSERFPPYANIAFIPNADLKKETSRGGEIGVRGNGDAGWFNVAGYYTYYDDFIWSGYQLPAGDIPSWVLALVPGAFTTMVFQSVNAEHAIIKGVEASGQLRLGYFSDALAGWSVNASASIANGRLIQPGDSGYTPLNTVDPAKAVLGIAYDGERWGAELVGTGVRRHSRLDDSTVFRPPGYGKIDLFAHYRPTRNLELNVGLNNLTDRTYWEWGSLQSSLLGTKPGSTAPDTVSSSSGVLDMYTMPGRSISASLRYTF
ncbi:TonB-dependent hemoglobin/transferrin/lactoferrin family receptor [Stenotrophomonas sp. MMGLT7]|uniref:TonB-dependent hemoglobin/transferrin/lactoferrin family receptor n=1 Tax=Stenotrophomonas sp. MMGLT7 TaxID=2901227 RepID=UPI001E61913A|nr:TonB-dependent hemoglobin/transferrin/lactoferrin family receptor [Stenotrophomonas sp. MMGLT7]MCD7098270.1 TonB-dependent hemoglobin/transferrin/lactoferrin family receptor [Stenotrophomonas sp. MMGLT7]